MEENNKDNIVNNEAQDSSLFDSPKEDSILSDETVAESETGADEIIQETKELSEDKADIQEADLSESIAQETVDETVDETLNVKQEEYSAVVEDDTEFNSDDSLVTVRPVRFQNFDEPVVNLAIKKNLDIMQDIPMHITVELGRTKSTIKDIINMNTGSIVELDKIAGEQVEIYANEKLVARGEVIVIEDKFGVRVVNTNIPKEIL